MDKVEDFLMHHGIKGQKWGEKNGPPYPLDDDISTGKRLKTDEERFNMYGPSKGEKIKVKVNKKDEAANIATALGVGITGEVAGAAGSFAPMVMDRYLDKKGVAKEIKNTKGKNVPNPMREAANKEASQIAQAANQMSNNS